MAKQDHGEISVIKEGNVRKGGINSAPTVPRPSTTIPGFGLTSNSINGGSSTSSQGSSTSKK